MAVVKILFGSLTVIIAILTTYIAWQQHRTARDKIKLDLYDRRFRVYRGLMDLLACVLRDGSMSRDALGRYYAETDEKRFLFDGDVLGYMEEVREKAVRLLQARRRIESHHGVSEKQRDTAIVDETELLTWFDNQAEEAWSRFDKYLGFKRCL